MNVRHPYFKSTSGVRQEFCLKVEDDPSSYLFVVPGVKLSAFFDRHTFGHVERFVGETSHVRLVFGRIKQVRNVSFLQFGEPERLGEVAQRHLKERERVDEPYGYILVSIRELQNFPTVPDLFDLSLLSVEFVDDGVTVVAFEIVG